MLYPICDSYDSCAATNSNPFVCRSLASDSERGLFIRVTIAFHLTLQTRSIVHRAMNDARAKVRYCGFSPENVSGFNSSQLDIGSQRNLSFRSPYFYSCPCFPYVKIASFSRHFRSSSVAVMPPGHGFGLEWSANGGGHYSPPFLHGHLRIPRPHHRHIQRQCSLRIPPQEPGVSPIRYTIPMLWFLRRSPTHITTGSRIPDINV